jgi:predicted N-acetyltransferase YhbS
MLSTSRHTQIADLFKYPQHISLVARWIYDEFWADKNVHTPVSLEKLLRLAIAPSAIPVSLLALEDERPVATINLIENDDETRPHLRPWLAALFVDSERRGRGIGSLLVRNLQDRAAAMGIDAMYLGTDNPGFYARLGAAVYEQASDTFWIMRLNTRAH